MNVYKITYYDSQNTQKERVTRYEQAENVDTCIMLAKSEIPYGCAPLPIMVQELNAKEKMQFDLQQLKK